MLRGVDITAFRMLIGIVVAAVRNLQTTIVMAGVFVAVLFAIALASGSTVSAAQSVPYKVNFQGRLTNTAGNVMADGLYNVKFRIWTAAGGGSNTWTELRETTNRVQVTNGLFSVQLGDVSALSPSLFTTQPIFFEVELPTTATATCSTASCAVFDGTEVMTPRQPFGAAPYAMNADTVDGIDGASLAQLSPGAQQTGFLNVSGNITSGGFLQAAGATLGGVLTLQETTAPTGTAGFGKMYVSSGDSKLHFVDDAGVDTAFGAGGGSGVSNLQGAYDGGGSIKLDATRSTFAIQDANTTIGTSLVAIRASNAAGAGADLFKIGNTGATVFQNTVNSTDAFNVNSASGMTLLTVDTETVDDLMEIQIGSNNTIDAVQINLSLDSSSTFIDQGACSSGGQSGAMYYNTTSGSVRACIGANAAWEDIVTTAALGLQLFGVVPDTGSANVGDLAGVAGATTGPCKVYMGTLSTSVSWNDCTAYSAGRKVRVLAGTNVAVTGATGQYQHLCLTGTGNQPVLSAAGTEFANLPTFSAASPVLCLADVMFSAANAIGDIFDTRTFTTTSKTYATVNSTGGLGFMVVGTTTRGVYVNTTLAANLTQGVIVASTGVASTTTINAVISVQGPTWVKATAGAVTNFVRPGTVAGRATMSATANTTVFNSAGIALTAFDSTCLTSANCSGSVYFIMR